MTKEELAALLNGREYGKEITDAEEAAAKAATPPAALSKETPHG